MMVLIQGSSVYRESPTEMLAYAKMGTKLAEWVFVWMDLRVEMVARECSRL